MTDMVGGGQKEKEEDTGATVNSKGKSEAEKWALKKLSLNSGQKNVQWVPGNSSEYCSQTRNFQETFFKFDWEKNSITILDRKYIRIQREYLTKTNKQTNNNQVDLESFIKH